MTLLSLVRHGTTDAVGSWLCGRMSGVPLNREGAEQAARLGSFLASAPLAAVYSSPLERALHTANAVARPHRLEVRQCADLIDIDFGAWTGASLSDLREDATFRRFNQQRSLACPPNGEQASDVQARMVRALFEIARFHAGSNVVVVGHCDPLRAALAFFLGISLDLAQRFEISPGSVSRLELGEEVRLYSLNQIPTG